MEVRRPADLPACDGLVLPGGESTSLALQIDFIGLRQPLIEFARRRPVFGTCAGLILLAASVEGGSVASLGILDIEVQRNAYGRQCDSFQDRVKLIEPDEWIQAAFIRAPKITAVRGDARVLGTRRNAPVFVQQRYGSSFLLGATFHPEIAKEPHVHRRFLALAEQAR